MSTKELLREIDELTREINRTRKEMAMRTSYSYYRVISNQGTGDTYYTYARSAKEARRIAGFEYTSPQERPVVARCSKKEADKTGYAIHRRF